MTTTILMSKAFGEQLRSWRELLRVSQLELAMRAGTTQRHLSYLERGRSAPGRGMVIRLAESLDLSLRDRNGLLLSAGYAPVYPESQFDDDALHSVRTALEAVLAGHEPYPAMVVNRAGDLMLANRACSLFLDGLPPKLAAHPINTRRVALHPEGLAPRITNFHTWAPHVTEGLRRELRHHPDPSLASLLEELEGYLAEVPLASDHLGFAVPLELTAPQGPMKLITTITTFATATDVLLAELRMEAFLPIDDATAERLRQRARTRGDKQPRGNHSGGRDKLV